MGNAPSKIGITVKNQKVTTLARKIEFEYKGKPYYVLLNWDECSGFDPQWLDESGKDIDEPAWLIRHDQLDIYEELDVLAKAQEREHMLRAFLIAVAALI